MARPGSDSGNLDFPSVTEAHHDADGMYKMKDPDRNGVDSENMVQLESGIYIENPDTWKAHSILWLNGNSGLASIECAETYDEIKAAIAHAQSADPRVWYEFTDPAFGHKTLVPGAMLAKPMFISTQYKDMEAIKAQIKQQQMQQRLQRLQQASQERSSKIVTQYKRDGKN